MFLQYHNLGLHSVSIPQLNKILLNVTFWSSIHAKHALLFQTDSLLLRDNIGQFLQYDYIGAPWHTANERWQFMKSIIPEGVGNGGLSLRNNDAMIQLSRQLGPSVADGLQQEDFVYAMLLQYRPHSHIAPRSDAYQFCVEVPCEDVEDLTVTDGGCNPLTTLANVPTALHATWYYFSSPEDRYKDLLKMLEISVCGNICGASTEA